VLGVRAGKWRRKLVPEDTGPCGFASRLGDDVSGRWLLSAMSLSTAEVGAASAGRNGQAKRQARRKSKVSKNGFKYRV
jgi:hypothetical protein